jgi:hypothetical protein
MSNIFIFGYGMIFIVVLAVLFGGLMMWIAAKIAGVRKATFGRAVVAAIGCAAVSFLLGAGFHFIPIFGDLVGFFIGLVLSILVIKGAFDTTTGKALLVWIFEIIAAFVAIVIGTMLAAGTFILLP